MLPQILIGLSLLLLLGIGLAALFLAGTRQETATHERMDEDDEDSIS